MVVSTQTSAVTYLANGATTNWPFAFQVPDLTTLQVKTKDPNGVMSNVSSSDYSVTGGPTGGSVLFPKAGPPLKAGWRIRIQRVVPIIQNVEIVSQEGYYPEVLEDSADYRTFIDQQLGQRIVDIEANDVWGT